MLTRAELETQAKRAAVVRKGLAGPQTPFIRRAWYVAARGDEIGRFLFRRRILGMDLVFFRTESGTVVALQNRCGHRSFPLSEGRLEGDTLVCGYHGLRYGSNGLCTEIPMEGAVKGRFGVRAFPLVEQGPFVWIWMGEPEHADATALPKMEWLDHSDWDTQIGYALAPGNYVHLHENLLDLSHLSFLHAATFGTPEYAQAPVEIQIEADDIQVWRHVACFLPPVYAKPLGWEGCRAMRRSGSQLVSPALHVNTGLFENLEWATQPNPQPMVKVAQLLTPETPESTHYYYALCRNFALGDPEIGAQMLAGLGHAFAEDLYALEKMTEQHHLAGDNAPEFDIPTDRAGLEMRRRFKALADAEG